jgi:hypothetical protein
MNGETLAECVNRAKARWLKRVMYGSTATSTQKVLAYAIADHLNCVTLDCWPSQRTLMNLLGRRSDKTPQRAARGLQALTLITISRGSGHASGYRYSPVFRFDDWDKIGKGSRQNYPAIADRDVPQSSLNIQLESFSTAAPQRDSKISGEPTFKPAERGALEIKLAGMLGPAGFEQLARLGAIDDAIVDRLCRSLAAEQVGDRELAAARLAAQQAR